VGVAFLGFGPNTKARTLEQETQKLFSNGWVTKHLFNGIHKPIMISQRHSQSGSNHDPIMFFGGAPAWIIFFFLCAEGSIST